MKLREADLKLKEVKCNFLKKHIQYLGHIVSGKGITPMPEKFVCIKEMPPLQNTKGNKTIPWTCGILSKIHTQIF